LVTRAYPSGHRQASAAEREQLHATFAALCGVESPSGHERGCADWLTRELTAMGLEVSEDASGPESGSDAGNLTARIPGAGGPDGPFILFCAHMDTVPLAAPVEPVQVDGAWENAHAGILGADNKSAVAIFTEVARHWSAAAAAGTPPPVGIELVFTICEEVSLLGSRAFDSSSLRSSLGFVFDQATPIGGVIVASPTHYRIIARLRGRAAHAGVRPEAGRSAIQAAARAVAAMELGRLDDETTANVGLIGGGSAINVVPERCELTAEVRSLDDERAGAVTTTLIDHLQNAADAGECDLDLNVERMFQGYRMRQRAPQVAIAERALSACGYAPERIVSGGASDVNSFMVDGLPCICLADGVQANHTSGERVTVQALEDMLDVALTIVPESAAELADGAAASTPTATGDADPEA
jgi:tripeptide aminopeptidase